MNRLRLISLLVTLMTLTNVNAAPDLAEALCKYAAEDNKSMIGKILEDNRVKIRHLYYAVQCNGKNLLEFASDHNALEAGTYIINRLPKNILMNDIATLSANDAFESIAIRRIKNHW